MKKLLTHIVILLLSLIALRSFAQVTDAQLTTDNTTLVKQSPPTPAKLGTFNDEIIAAKASRAQSNTFVGRQTMTPTSTIAGFNFGSFAGIPSSLINGDAWYNSSTGKITFREGGSNITIPALSATTNEIPKSNASGSLVPTGLFNTTLGNITLGTSLTGANRTLSADGSATDVGLLFTTKAAGNITLSRGSGGGFTLSADATNNYWTGEQLRESVFSGGSGTVAFPNGRTTTLKGGDGVSSGNGNGGNVIITSGTSTGTGTPGSVTITGGQDSSIQLESAFTNNQLWLNDGVAGSCKLTQEFSGVITLSSWDQPDYTGNQIDIIINNGGGGFMIKVNSATKFSIDSTGDISVPGIKTTCAGAVSGSIASIAGVLTVCP